MGFAYSPSTPTSLFVVPGSATAPGRGTVEPAVPKLEANSPTQASVKPVTNGLRSAIVRAKARFEELIEKHCAGQSELLEPKDLMELEALLHQEVGQECLDPLVGAMIQELHDDPEIQVRATVLQMSRRHLSLQKANQPVWIRLLGGSKVCLKTPYYLSRPPRRRGRPRKKKGRRKASNRGLYPVLKVLGLHFRASPALVSEVGRLVAIGTIEQAKDSLSRRGIQLGRKVISRITRCLAHSGLSYRDWMEKLTRAGARGHSAKGMRLVIGCDGGRVRIRCPKKRGRRRKSGRRGFDGEWKEPKVLVVYQIDEKGRKVKGGLCRYDATMRKADGCFEIITTLLQEIGANEAAEWVVVGDGAVWIWDRVPELVKALGFDADKVTQVLDWYHAVQRLHEIAAERNDWSNSERKRWVGKMKQHLRRDNVEKVLEQRSIFMGRGAKKRRKLFDYIEDRADKMRYGSFRKAGIPLGSGAVESCVRRVINLRLKSNGIFWLHATAEAVLHLRSQLLCGRWDEFVQTILRPSEVWRVGIQNGYEANRTEALSLCERRIKRIGASQKTTARHEAQAA